ncbi:polysaccharide lyase [Vibrio sp. WXL103]|uniref:polysaccharide lyase n=1 Tax=Vibrio sp. WXL103 TaxID=3450710 RepID=UPI003EC5453A
MKFLKVHKGHVWLSFLMGSAVMSGCQTAADLPLTCPPSKVVSADEHQRSSDLETLAGWGKQFGHVHSATIITDPIDSNNQVLRIELREGEQYQTRSGWYHRAEVYEQYRAPFDTPMRYQFRVYIPDEWQFADVRALIAQWHATPDRHLGEISRSPNLGIELRDNRFLIRGQTSPLTVNKHNKQGMVRQQYYLSPPIEKNRWYEFDIKVTWTHEPSGSLEINIDNNQVVEYSGATSYNDCAGPYFKMGIYRDDSPSTFVIYFDDYFRTRDN